MLAMRREISRDEIILDLIVSEYIYIFKMLVVLFFIESLLHLYNLEKIVLNRIIGGRISRSGIILLNVILSCNLRNEMIYYYFLKVSLTTRYLHLQNEIIGFW